MSICLFLKNKIFSTSVIELSKYFNVEFKGIIFNFQEIDYTNMISNLSEELRMINKKIIISQNNLKFKNLLF